MKKEKNNLLFVQGYCYTISRKVENLAFPLKKKVAKLNVRVFAPFLSV